MSYQTKKEHEDLRAKVRAFAEKEIKPLSFMLDLEAKFPTEVYKMLADMDLMGIPYPTKYGGSGLDYSSFAITVEELSRVDAGVGVTLAVHILSQSCLYNFGSEEQKQKFMVPMGKGKIIGAFALTEPNAGSDAGGMETTADPDGDFFVLNGGKIFITNAPHAGVYIVFAVTSPGMGARGVSAFIVEKGTPGFTIAEPYNKMGIRSSHTCEIAFNNARVPRANMLGKEGEGFRVAMGGLDGGRIAIASQALGIAQGAFEAALAYSKDRVQFGQPIAYNQAISFKLADMATKLRSARLLVYSAAALKDAGLPHGMEASMAKRYSTDMGVEVVNEALQIHGGAGYIKGTLVERAYRDIKVTTIYEGANEIQRIVIAGFIIGKAPKKEEKAKKSGAPTGITGVRKKMIFKDGNTKEKVAQLVAALKADGYDFSIGIDTQTPIPQAGRVVCVGKGIGDKKNLAMIEALAVQAGAAIASTRPVAETLRYMPLNRYIGMSGQKFSENLYIAIGVSGAGQHLKGIKMASTIVAINNNANAPIFKNCDYGIVGDYAEIVPLLTKALDTGKPKVAATQQKKIKRAVPKKLPPSYKIHICSGCGYEYDQALGDPSSDVLEGTPFAMLPAEWVCPECAEEKDQFI